MRLEIGDLKRRGVMGNLKFEIGNLRLEIGILKPESRALGMDRGKSIHNLVDQIILGEQNVQALPGLAQRVAGNRGNLLGVRAAHPHISLCFSLRREEGLPFR